MREIKFRGKSHDGEWVYGQFIRYRGIPSITDIEPDENGKCVNTICSIKRETIGQFIGLHDKKKMPIYEGDIIKCHDGTLCSVFWKDGGFCMEANPKSFGYDHDSPLYPYESLSGLQMQSYIRESCEVIGNIHDNPNLINDLRQ